MNELKAGFRIWLKMGSRLFLEYLPSLYQSVCALFYAHIVITLLLPFLWVFFYYLSVLIRIGGGAWCFLLSLAAVYEIMIMILRPIPDKPPIISIVPAVLIYFLYLIPYGVLISKNQVTNTPQQTTLR